MAFYYAAIEEIDHEVGRMIDVLKKKGFYDNTLIVFTADHGEYLGFHHLLLKGNFMYDPVMRVPLIIRHPDRRHAGLISEDLVSNIDLAPTLLRRTGCTVPETMPGEDLSSGKTERECLFAEGNRGQQTMARTRTDKLILCDKKRPSLYFDLEADPLEMENRFESAACQEALGRLREQLHQWRPPEKITETYLDETAPIIQQPNAADPAGEHRAAMIAYCQEKMRTPPPKAT